MGWNCFCNALNWVIVIMYTLREDKKKKKRLYHIGCFCPCPLDWFFLVVYGVCLKPGSFRGMYAQKYNNGDCFNLLLCIKVLRNFFLEFI